MVRFWIALILVLSASHARADWFYRFVGFTCDRANDQLIVYYKGAYNEAGEGMREAKRKNEWEPDSFIASMKDDDHIGKLTTVTKRCRLKHGNYNVRFGATPGNFNIQGRCGANISAWVEVRKNGKTILPHYELEGDCHDMSAPVTTKIVFSKKSSEPEFTKVLPQEFFQ